MSQCSSTHKGPSSLPSTPPSWLQVQRPQAGPPTPGAYLHPPTQPTEGRGRDKSTERKSRTRFRTITCMSRRSGGQPFSEVALAASPGAPFRNHPGVAHLPLRAGGSGWGAARRRAHGGEGVCRTPFQGHLEGKGALEAVEGPPPPAHGGDGGQGPLAPLLESNRGPQSALCSGSTRRVAWTSGRFSEALPPECPTGTTNDTKMPLPSQPRAHPARERATEEGTWSPVGPRGRPRSHMGSGTR